MVYGYCRISTKQQSIERQRRNIQAAYKDALILCEEGTGTNMNRPKFQQLLGLIHEGDTIVFDSVSRMSRNAQEGFATYKELLERGVKMVFLKEPYVNSETYQKARGENVRMTGTDVDIILAAINEYLLKIAEEQIRIAFEQAEKEVADLHQRTKEGILTARLAGKQIGREAGKTVETKKSVECKRTIKKFSRDFGGQLSDSEVMMICQCSRNSYYKYKSQLK